MKTSIEKTGAMNRVETGAMNRVETGAMNRVETGAMNRAPTDGTKTDFVGAQFIAPVPLRGRDESRPYVRKWMGFLVLVLTAGLGWAGAPRQVVVYCSLDRPYSEPVLRSFEKETGIQVRSVYDSEVVKTTGLVNRLLAEQKQPVCDVFWNNEKLRTVLLARRGALEKYEPSAWKTRQLSHDGKDGLWTEFAARARVIVYNPKFKSRICETPEVRPSTDPHEIKLRRRIADLEFRLGVFWNACEECRLLSNMPPQLKQKFAIAYPLFGTTSTQFLAWMNEVRKMGEVIKPGFDANNWLCRIFDNKPLVCSGNSDVVRQVAAGRAYLGFTDSDDAAVAMARGEPIDFVFPADPLQNLTGRIPTSRGALLIPNTVAIIRAAPHRKEAEALVDFLLSERIELTLANGPSKQIPLGEIGDPQMKANLPFVSEPHKLLKTRRANEEELIETYEPDMELLRKAFHR